MWIKRSPCPVTSCNDLSHEPDMRDGPAYVGSRGATPRHLRLDQPRCTLRNTVLSGVGLMRKVIQA